MEFGHYLVGEFLDAGATSEPGQRGVDEVKYNDKCEQVGGDVGDQRYGVRSTWRRSVDEIYMRPVVPQKILMHRGLLRGKISLFATL